MILVGLIGGTSAVPLMAELESAKVDYVIYSSGQDILTSDISSFSHENYAETPEPRISVERDFSKTDYLNEGSRKLPAQHIKSTPYYRRMMPPHQKGRKTVCC